MNYTPVCDFRVQESYATSGSFKE